MLGQHVAVRMRSPVRTFPGVSISGKEGFMPETSNHCALCGVEIEPEGEFCEECQAGMEKQDPCPECGQRICVCEVGLVD